MIYSFEESMDAKNGLAAKLSLNNGVAMPWLGLGVYLMESDALASESVLKAIRLGYRRVDTAAIYGNERGVGKGIRDCGLSREELFLTTKVWNDEMRADRAGEAFEESLERLGLDYVDLLLLHWPIEGKIRSSWEDLLPHYEQGRIKALGVSNFLPEHLEELRSVSSIVPAVNQIEFHPYLQSRKLKTYCESHDIRVEAWSPFMRGGSIFSDVTLTRIARNKRKTVAQVILRWILQNGVLTIPKTVSEERMAENSNVFDFSLSTAEMAEIANLDRAMRSGPDPENFDF